MELHGDMTPEEIRAARRDSLDEWRRAHGMPPWRGWRFVNEDPMAVTFAWVVLAFALSGLGVPTLAAIVAPFVVLVAQVHISRAVRRRQRSTRQD